MIRMVSLPWPRYTALPCTYIVIIKNDKKRLQLQLYTAKSQYRLHKAAASPEH